ncbi:MAG: hypothetical protein JWO82_3681, partial [Akkermansiaceae bacterium]|nr:hypothetical protein [Akkermansiaceae bacterium]
RLSGYQEAGVSYVYQASGDLLNWHGVTPDEVGVSAVTDRPGYEMAELRLPAAEVVNHDRLFVRVAVPH